MLRKHLAKPTSTILMVLALFWMNTTVGATEFRAIQGHVKYGADPVCSMVLANGQYMFSCGADGAYELTVPLDGNGQITLYSFAFGFAPYKKVLAPTGDLTIKEIQVVRNDGVEPPTVDDPYTGGWTGTMTYDRNSTDTCYDADVTMFVDGTDAHSMVVRPAGLKPAILPTRFSIPSNGYVQFISSSNYWCGTTYPHHFCVFGTRANFTLQFTPYGSSSGEWQEQSYDCYGTWTFTKD